MRQTPVAAGSMILFFILLTALLLSCSVQPAPSNQAVDNLQREQTSDTSAQETPLQIKKGTKEYTEENSKETEKTSIFWNPDATWQKPSDEQLKKMLTPLQYQVTQQEGTERPFNNEYWDNHEEGIYVDMVSGEPLFASKDKFESGTGWPSFTKPLDDSVITTRTDYSLGMPRTEVRSKIADSHLGHVFDDGPAPLGLRYCMNSAALRFVPKDQMEAEGYGKYLDQFNDS